MVLAIYNSLAIPHEQAFKEIYFKSFFSVALNHFIDMCFALDIILTFNTSVLTKKGVESFDSKVISDSYVGTSRFFIDVLSLLGAEILSGISYYMSLLGILKIARVFRITTLIRNLTVDKQTKAALNLGKILFYLVFYVHFMGCYLWVSLG